MRAEAPGAETAEAETPAAPELAPTPSAPPAPSPSLMPAPRPSAYGLGAAFASSQRELERDADSGLLRPSGWSQPPPRSRQPGTRAAWASLLGSLVSSGALAAGFWLRSSSHDTAAALAAARAPARAAEGSIAASAVSPRERVGVQSPRARALAAAPAPSAAPGPSSMLVGAHLADEELLQLFKLERRAQLPSCAERLGASAREYTGASPGKSQAALKAARRELLRGNNAEAQQLLCSATLHFPDNVAAWRALADLELHLGDAARAEQAIEQALKRNPADTSLLATLGDIKAVRGDLAQSRALWTKGVRGSGSDPESVQRLAQQFASLGQRKLRDWSYGAALVQFRRAVVLSQGAQAPSSGMAEALRSLGQPAAALAWADRVVAPDDH